MCGKFSFAGTARAMSTAVGTKQRLSKFMYSHPHITQNLRACSFLPARRLLSTITKQTPSFSLRTVPMRYPFLFGIVLSSTKSGAADIMIQTCIEGTSVHKIDWRRTKSFAMFGALFCGVWQYFLFVKAPRCPLLTLILRRRAKNNAFRLQTTGACLH